MKLTVVDDPTGARVLVADRGTFWATSHRSVADALAAGAHFGAPDPGWVEVAEPAVASIRPLVTATSKVLCVGHNYRSHMVELGHDLPEHPTVFSKFPDSLVGPAADVRLDPAAELWDWEAELAFVVGRTAHRVPAADATSYIAGYTVANDVTARDWQRRSSQWLLGKTFPSTSPIGPWLVTADEADPADGLTISCAVDGVEKQRSSTSDLLFGVGVLLAVISRALILNPGDVVLTGTPGGVGVARDPVERLSPGRVLTTSVEGVGELTNRCVAADVRALTAPSDASPTH